MARLTPYNLVCCCRYTQNGLECNFEPSTYAAAFPGRALSGFLANGEIFGESPEPTASRQAAAEAAAGSGGGDMAVETEGGGGGAAGAGGGAGGGGGEGSMQVSQPDPEVRFAELGAELGNKSVRELKAQVFIRIPPPPSRCL